jgi:hypothetical protein
MSDRTERQWCRMFKDERTNVRDEERSGQPSTVEWSCSKCWPKCLWKMALHNFRTLCDFPQISCTVLYEIITVRLGYHKFYTRWVLKMVMGVHKTQRMDSALEFSRVIPQRWEWISQSHCINNRWWNLGYICVCWNQRAVKGVDAHTFTKQAEKV